MSVYGEWCPKCSAEIVSVTRGIPSMGTCKNGHTTDRRDTLRREPAPRTDLSQASVAAALEAAAMAAKLAGPSQDLAQEELSDIGKERRVMSMRCEAAIRALITPAQHDALAAHVAAEVAKARAEDAQAVKMLVFAAQTFCNRVEAGEIRSKRSYAMFKDALAQIGAKP